MLEPEHYEVVGYTVKNFEYRTPHIRIDENGEAQIEYDKDSIRVGSITLLQKHGIKDGKLVKVESIESANNFILHKKINDELQNLSTHSTALIHYFHFLEAHGLTWDEMPPRNSAKPTYKYRKYLKEAYISQEADHLARTTCNSYIGVVTNFYKFQLANGYKFVNKPFEHEILSITLDNDHSHIQGSHRHAVHTTDLRLKLGRDKRNDGTARILIPLSDREWEELDRIIRKERQVIKISHGIERVVKLDLESSLMFMIERYTGTRREEMLSLRSRHVRNPSIRDKEIGYCPVDIGSQNNSLTKGGNNPDRTIHVPLGLMEELHKYVSSKRYNDRRKKYDALVTQSKTAIVEYSLAKENANLPTPIREPKLKSLEKNSKDASGFLAGIATPKEHFIFLNNVGKPYALTSSNARWSEIRNTVSKSLGYRFEHKPHNLRSTYAVCTLRQLLAKGMGADVAVEYIQARLGHVSTDTTMVYLKFAKNEISGHEIFEHALDFLLDDVDFEIGED